MRPGQSLFIICELSQTHEGSLEIAKLLVKAAAKAGADAVKVQVFFAHELAVSGYRHFELFKQLEWREAQWTSLVECGHENGLKVYADVFGTESLSMLLRIGIDGLKIHGTDMRNRPLLEALSSADRPLLLSIGGGTLDEAMNALSILKNSARKSPIVLMHGIQSYPTLVEHTNLGKMKYFKDKTGLPVGYADHLAGDSPLDVALCAAAIGMGAVVIEKHITVSRILNMEDFESALSPDRFAVFVSRLREIETALGTYSDALIPVEEAYRQSTRKHVVTRRTISAGQVIHRDDVDLRRAECDASPSDLEDVIGKRADRQYEVEEVLLTENLVDHTV
ncbi:MAG TPA: N-acetylneuraminate synthase family protein [Syntrophales bacterium]|mgnify:FL=1|nr:N-acetylneuraminate synthase family protein [Syntrophales bacterium]HRT71220.1 N-acetylneuraminate synthase family protein [Syntrophales bacterium]